MHHPLTSPLSALLLPLLALAAPPQALESGLLPTPELTRAEVRGDTLWLFEGGRRGGPPRDAVAYGRDLDAPGWVRRDGRRAGPDPRRLPASASDTVPAGEGLALVRLDDGRRGSRNARYGVHRRADGRTVPLEAEIPADVKQEVFPREIFYETPSPEEVAGTTPAAPSAWTRGGGALWAGLGGGFPEGVGGLGGLLRYDPETGRVEGIWRRELAGVTATDLAVAHGRVWIATLSPGEYGPYGTRGLLAWDPAADSLERYGADDTPLPSDVVWSVEAAGGRVWAATRKGVAALDPATGEWTVARFHPALEGDELVFDLEEGAAPPDSARVGAFLLMEGLGVERRSAFLEAARSVPDARFRAYARNPREPESTLAHPGFVPFLLEALGDRGSGRLAARSLKEIPPERREAAVARALEEAPGEEAAAMALHLAWEDLSRGPAWIRAHLDPARSDSATVAAAVESAGQAQDSASAPALVELVEADGPHAPAAVKSLIRIGAPEGWEAVGAWLDRHPGHRGQFLEWSRRWSSWGAWERAPFRRVLCSAAHETLDARNRNVAQVAAVVLAELEDPAGLRALVERFTGRAYHLQYSQQVLERITGAESPVHPREWTADALAEARAFWRTWLEEGGTEGYASCRRARGAGPSR